MIFLSSCPEKTGRYPITCSFEVTSRKISFLLGFSRKISILAGEKQNTARKARSRWAFSGRVLFFTCQNLDFFSKIPRNNSIFLDVTSKNRLFRLLDQRWAYCRPPWIFHKTRVEMMGTLFSQSFQHQINWKNIFLVASTYYYWCPKCGRLQNFGFWKKRSALNSVSFCF